MIVLMDISLEQGGKITRSYPKSDYESCCCIHSLAFTASQRVWRKQIAFGGSTKINVSGACGIICWRGGRAVYLKSFHKRHPLCFPQDPARLVN
ncbi:hypothetical protein CEXT_411581 [Caerostris extrusa]|uniref:Uncharacterized protein n=1 Tax=Caerostris extrusa TaxID=172846 RepID=A0AAV4NVY1_CAEEX|nr:hypothetical protein CEXT_411581 [Caerostris extrusa]